MVAKSSGKSHSIIECKVGESRSTLCSAGLPGVLDVSQDRARPYVTGGSLLQSARGDFVEF